MQEITYKDLIELALNKIYSVCGNIDSIKPTVPKSIINGYSWQVGLNSTVAPAKRGPAQHTEATVTDGIVKVVSSDIVKQQLFKFLQDRGCLSKLNSIITSRGLLVLCNNIGSFICTKVQYVKNPYTEEGCAIYVDTNNEFPSVSLVDTTNFISQQECEYTTKSVLQCINTVNNEHRLSVQLTFACSCCSSSSSSSSCSCSSSSSIFIAYMRI